MVAVIVPGCTGVIITAVPVPALVTVVAHAADDVAGFVHANLAFHDVILHASDNVFLGVLFDPLSRVLASRRTQTSRVSAIQAHAIEQHGHIVRAPESGNAEQARQAMDGHVLQTLNDLKSYVLHKP